MFNAMLSKSSFPICQKQFNHNYRVFPWYAIKPCAANFPDTNYSLTNDVVFLVHGFSTCLWLVRVTRLLQLDATLLSPKVSCVLGWIRRGRVDRRTLLLRRRALIVLLWRRRVVILDRTVTSCCPTGAAEGLLTQTAATTSGDASVKEVG